MSTASSGVTGWPARYSKNPRLAPALSMRLLIRRLQRFRSDKDVFRRRLDSRSITSPAALQTIFEAPRMDLMSSLIGSDPVCRLSCMHGDVCCIGALVSTLVQCGCCLWKRGKNGRGGSKARRDRAWRGRHSESEVARKKVSCSLSPNSCCHVWTGYVN